MICIVAQVIVHIYMLSHQGKLVEQCTFRSPIFFLPSPSFCICVKKTGIGIIDVLRSSTSSYRAGNHLSQKPEYIRLR